ncbi:hypothetical protein LWI28_020726 [Acer negundo]|uniref:Uncharacterized protein n=1 Tax=Acer negundo TaxID=4023 RepID=A0AAD5I7Q8_ACENE|nr:hypothetical protein LWI28_020726 [Acer negundo]
MKTESLLAYNWLVGNDANHWSKAFFKDTILCDIVCNNMCEVFNAAIIVAQDKPVITMMEMIRNYLMTRLVRKRTELEKLSHQIGPKVFRFVEEIKQESVSNAILSTVETTLTKKCGKEGHNRATCGKMGEGTDSVATIEGGSQVEH